MPASQRSMQSRRMSTAVGDKSSLKPRCHFEPRCLVAAGSKQTETLTVHRFHNAKPLVPAPADRRQRLTQTPNPQHPAPSTQHPAPSTQHPAPSTQHPAPSTQHPAPSTQHPAPSTQHPLVSTTTNQETGCIPRRPHLSFVALQHEQRRRSQGPRRRRASGAEQRVTSRDQQACSFWNLAPLQCQSAHRAWSLARSWSPMRSSLLVPKLLPLWGFCSGDRFPPLGTCEKLGACRFERKLGEGADRVGVLGGRGKFRRVENPWVFFWWL
ncbi:hypothetical protein EV126DRAFT_216065 [Verticillium dahliae]|nr:hypothetical protein EV126DRAFT_216065 [Verticillium dahliae]